MDGASFAVLGCNASPSVTRAPERKPNFLFVLTDNQRFDAMGFDFDCEKTPSYHQILRERGGYRSAPIGKWHMGLFHTNPRPGFDYWLSFKDQDVLFGAGMSCGWRFCGAGILWAGPGAGRVERLGLSVLHACLMVRLSRRPVMSRRPYRDSTMRRSTTQRKSQGRHPSEKYA